MGGDARRLEGYAPADAAETAALRWRGVLGGALLVLLLGPNAAGAAAENKGYAVSPALQEMSLLAGQAEAEYTLTITNRSTAPQVFRLSALDFGALNESGGVAFLGETADELEHKYGLASWMKLGQNEVSVPAGRSVAVRVAIENRPTLAPGGHYGAVLATALTAPSGAAAEPRVGVKQVLSSLILLVKEGGGLPDLRLVSQELGGSLWRLPGEIKLRFQNAGAMHVTPRGVVTVRDPWRRVVARGALNEESGMVLPESFRRYQTPLTGLAAAWMPGRYEVSTVYRYDGTEATKTMVTGFWYAGSWVVWLVGLLALAAAGILVWWLFGRARRRRK